MARSKSPAGGKGTRANKTADATKEQAVNPGVEAGVGVSAPGGNSSSLGEASSYKPQAEPNAQPKPPTEPTSSTEIDPQTTAKSQPEIKPQAEAKAESRKLEVMKTDGRKNLVPINLEDEIRRRAYELYQQRGSKGGSEAEDWLAAEREIRQRYRQQSA